MHHILVELKRRRVIPVAAIYVVCSWLVLQIADVLFPAWGLAPRNLLFLLYAAVFGFPLALLFAWRYDLTSNGIVRTNRATAVDRGQPDLGLTRIDIATLTLIALAVVSIGAWLFAQLIPADPTIPTGPSNSVAVLPFQNGTGEPDREVMDLADGLVTSLVTIKGLNVSGRESSFYFSDPDVSLLRVARLLGVGYLVTGQVTPAGSVMKISIQLIEMPQQTTVWAQTFVTSADRGHEIYGSISDAVAHAMQVNILDSEHARIIERSRISPELVNLLRLIKLKLEAGEYFTGIELANQAVERFPDSAEAHVRRALTYLFIYSYMGSPELASMLQAVDSSLDAAERLGTDSADYHLARAMQARRIIRSSGTTPGLEKQLEDSFEKAIERNPSDAQAYVSYSIYFRRKREFSREADLLEKAMEYDPLHPGAILQYSRFLSAIEEHEEAVEYAMRLPEYFGFGYDAVANRYWEMQHFDKAIEWFKKDPEPSDYVSWLLAANWAILRRPQEAIAALNAIGDDETLRPIATSLIAGLHGDMEFGFTNLAQVMDQKSTHDPRVILTAANFALRTERYSDAIEIIEHGTPALSDPTAPIVETEKIPDAIYLAFALSRQPGNEVRVGILSSHILADTRGRPRTGWDGIGIRDALVYAFQNDAPRAVSAMQEAYDAGWRELYDDLGLMPMPLEQLRGNPEFERLVANINRDLDATAERANALNTTR